MSRKERRASVLADRKERKKARTSSGDELFAWMASLLPAAAGPPSQPLRALEVGSDARATRALEERGWAVVAADPGAVLAPGEFAGEPVDAVTCWLLEAPMSRPAIAERLRAMGMRTTEEARLAMQTLVYRLADRVLRPGGLLQVVDRVSQPFDEALAAGMVRLQRAQAKGTLLEFASIDARPAGRGAVVSVRSRKGS